MYQINISVGNKISNRGCSSLAKAQWPLLKDINLGLDYYI
jgi:hypothetical protein